MNLTGKGPLGLKAPKPAKVKGVRKGQNYLDRVRGCACWACGKPGPSEAHHCRDMPDFDERHIYTRMPGAGRTSDDRDALPLCSDDHRLFHLARKEFHRRYGRDYRMLDEFRALLDEQDTIDF